MKRLSPSKLAVFFILLFSLAFSYNNRFWERGLIEWDVTYYYGYLPATFIYKDLKLKYAADPNFKGTLWPEPAPNGNLVIKTTAGLAILYCPFFLMAHGIAHLFPQLEANGYSPIYSFFLLVANIFYTILGFYFLRKILLKHFSEAITTYVILTFFFSTNLFFYSLYNAMAHCYLFSLITIIVYYTCVWHQNPSVKNSILLGLLLGLTVLIRPTHLLLVLFFIFYDVYNYESLKSKIQFLLKTFSKSILIVLAAFLVISIQLCYWKYITGSWIYWSYNSERFFWTKPHIIEGLFGYRKGLFLYMPILFFATIGLFLLRKSIKSMSLILPILILLITYILLCWWSWWFGGGFSIRPFVDLYVFFAIGLAAILQQIASLKNVFLKATMFTLIILSGAYSSFVIAQYHNGTVHYDSMTKESWKASFLKLHVGSEYWDTLKQPNYEKAKLTGEE
jgi:hypothetical protein